MSSDPVEPDTWAAAIRVARPGLSPEGPELPQDAIEVRLARRLGGGMVERIDVRNHGMTACTVLLAIDVTADSQKRSGDHPVGNLTPSHCQA